MTIQTILTPLNQALAELRQLTDSASQRLPSSAVAGLLALPAVGPGDEDEAWRALGQLQAKDADVSWLGALWCWRELLQLSACHKALRAGLDALALPLLPLLAGQLSDWARPGQAPVAQLDALMFHLQRWYPGVGPADKLLARFEALVAGLGPAPDAEQLFAGLRQFNADCDKDLERAARLAERLEASELGNIRAASARAQVDTLFNQQVAGRPLTEETARFIDATLMPSLQYLLINGDANSPEWEFWTRALGLTVWSLMPDKSPDEVQTFYNRGPTLVRQLEEAAPPPSCPPALYQQFVGALSADVITLLKGQTLETITLAPRTLEDAPALPANLAAAGAAEPWRPGGWLMFRGEGDSDLRCQCLLQVPGTDQLLFVNRAGRKVLQKSVAQMHACYEAGIARNIDDQPVFSQALTLAVKRLLIWHRQLTTREALAGEARRAAEQQAAAREQARQEEAAARARAKAKAEAEAVRLAAERKAQQAREAELAREDAERVRGQEIELQVDQLTLGTWADIPGPEGGRLRAKLAVSMRSTGRYIFVDRVGSKVAEYKRDQLIALLLAGEVILQRPEQGFESRLETIVRGLRKTD